MQLTEEEVVAGIVVHLDTTMLRSIGGSETNAERAPAGDRAVAGAHDFLVLGVDAPTGMCTAVPLFEKTAVGNQPLDSGKKAGHDKWLGAHSFFSRWQHWRIPVSSVVAASVPDDTTRDTRRRYAADDPVALADIRTWERRNRSPYRAA